MTEETPKIADAEAFILGNLTGFHESFAADPAYHTTRCLFAASAMRVDGDVRKLAADLRAMLNAIYERYPDTRPS